MLITTVIAGENSQKDGVFRGWHFLAKTLGDLKRLARKEVSAESGNEWELWAHGTNGSAPAGLSAPLPPDACHALTEATFLNEIALLREEANMDEPASNGDAVSLPSLELTAPVAEAGRVVLV